MLTHKTETLPSQDVVVRELTTTDLPAVAAIHIAAFPDSALSKLGIEATRRYYEWQLLGPHDIAALGASRGDELVGFCYGGVFRGAMSGFMQKNKTFLVIHVLTHPWLAINPVFRDRLNLGARVLKRKSNARMPDQAPPKEEIVLKRFGILAIAVAPEGQGLGIGKMLMGESEAIARERGFQQMNLSVHLTNRQAIGFYERLGWERISKDGVWSGNMQKHFMTHIHG